MKKILMITISISLIVGSLALYVGFQHNPQMEFFDTGTGTIDYRYSFIVFAVWFGVSFVPLTAIGCAAMLLVRWARMKCKWKGEEGGDRCELGERR